MTEDQLPLRVGTPDDWDGVARLLTEVFHDVTPPDAEFHEIERDIFEPVRSLIAEDGGRVVAHAGAYTRELTVPGAVVPAAHVTMVGVAPTHRRRGLLTRAMQRQLREIRDAGTEPIAVLWASEGRIYPRFGYGQASQVFRLRFDTREVRINPGPAVGRLRAGPPDAIQVELAKVYDQLRADRPGWSSRDERWWRYVLADPPSRRHGDTERRAVVHEGPAGVDGYALWRVKGSWEDGGPNGAVTVNAVVAGTPEAYRALWGFLLAIDLTRSVSYWSAPVDDPLLHLVNEPRRLSPTLADSLWVRVVDVPAALAARRYAVPVDVVLDVTDALLPENQGRWHLVGGVDEASCVPTEAEPDLACDVVDVAAAYLGGITVAALAGAGRVRELRPGTLGPVSAAFGWHRAPAAHEVF
jgi:predicted acetyltransferase